MLAGVDGDDHPNAPLYFDSQNTATIGSVRAWPVVLAGHGPNVGSRAASYPDRPIHCTMLADMETSDIRRRLRHALEEAKKATADRHARADAASAAYAAFLENIATPVFRMMANVARGEGHPFSVFAPAEGVRLVSDRHGEDFIEVWLDMSLDPPQVATRVNRVRGRNVTTSEGQLRADAPIDTLVDEDVLAFLLAHIGLLVER